MQKLMVLSLIALATAIFVAVPTAAAGGDDRGVVKSGRCNGSSTWKLKAKHDDGRIEVEFEVDQNVVGRRWRTVLRRDGALVYRRVRITRAPSGSFEVRRLIRNSAGRDRIVARARALATGETCRGVVTI
jgi:hypothetical protein